MLISIEIDITCDFPGGGGPDPLSPLWIRTCHICNRCWSKQYRHIVGILNGTTYAFSSLPLNNSRRVVVSYNRKYMCTKNWLTACSSLPRKKCG